MVAGSVLVGHRGPLGAKLCYEDANMKGFGRTKVPGLYLAKGAANKGIHLAFAASSRAAVDGFHEAALKACGKDNGAPGIRADYAPTYYAAFVIDPDGNNVEAVWQRADEPPQRLLRGGAGRAGALPPCLDRGFPAA